MKNNKMMIFLRGLILENPVLVLVLGTCPTLAQTTSVIGALGMGIAATLVLIGSNVVISALRRLIPDIVRIPCYIVIIATFVTVVQLLMHAYLPDLYEMMGVYLALIVVNCIILGRAEMFARKNGVLDSAVDGLGMGLGFLLALLCMATVREVLGAGTFAGLAVPFFKTYHIPILTKAPGGFLVFGILIAIMNKIKEKDGGVKRKSFSCEGCPSAAHCKKASCPEMIDMHTQLANDNTAKEETENDA
ncbi:MAG: electron transport complex subunit RsxE [Clostridia bacterium]|nr:electron transport complex subunit RsxE [Clostridia bacterium]